MRLKPIESWEVSAARLAAEAFVVAVLCGAFLWPFRLYGFDLIDEGTQLAQIERVASGARPYVDFETGYTPLYFAFEAWLFDLGGGTIVAIRTFGVILQAVLVGGLFASVRAWAGPQLASAVAALFVAFFLPVSLRTGAPFNIPYPGWLAAPAALAVQVMVSRVSARRIRRRDLVLFASGALAGVAFSVKPNSGLLVLAGAALALSPSWSPRRPLDRLLSAALRLGAVVATAVLLAPGFGYGYAIALLVPVALAAWRTAPAFEDGDAALRQLGALAAGFVVVVGTWLVPLARRIGTEGVLRQVLLLDGSVVDAYLLAFEPPALPTVALALGAVVAWTVRGRGRLLPFVLVTTGVVVALLGGALGARLAAENVLLWLGPIVLVLGLIDGAALARWPRERAALAFLAVYSLQLFPRPDSIHVAMGGAPLALGAALVWRRYERAWREATGGPGAVAWAALFAALVLAVGRAAPAWIPRVSEGAETLALGARAPVEVVARHTSHYDRAAKLVTEVGARSRPGEAVFGFPDIAGIGFLAARPQPYYYLYFVPGRPGRAGEARAIARLEEVAPPVAITCPPHVEAFSEAPAYFARLGDHLRGAYAPAAEVEGCIVHLRR